METEIYPQSPSSIKNYCIAAWEVTTKILKGNGLLIYVSPMLLITIVTVIVWKNYRMSQYQQLI